MVSHCTRGSRCSALLPRPSVQAAKPTLQLCELRRQVRSCVRIHTWPCGSGSETTSQLVTRGSGEVQPACAQHLGRGQGCRLDHRARQLQLELVRPEERVAGEPLDVHRTDIRLTRELDELSG